MVTANLAEALDVAQRVHGLSIPRAVQVLENRASRPISLADAALIASAKRVDRIATADLDVLAVASAEELGSVAVTGQG